jgi:hypothetical protein
MIYTGQDVFFPLNLNPLPYGLKLLSDTGDDPKHLREALFSFMVNVAYLNTKINTTDTNYSFLIHTSGKTSDHTVDLKTILKTLEAFKEANNPSHFPFFERIWLIAQDRYPGRQT